MKGDKNLQVFTRSRSSKISLATLLMFAALFAFSHDGAAETLAPFKDRLFAYPDILSVRDGGAYRVIDYQEMRDINGRDEVPERRVKQSFIDLGVRKVQETMTLRTDAGDITVSAVGAKQNASIITVFVHGAGGDHRLGANDYTFGGNFNRIKNLMVKAGGLYLSPSAGTFGNANAERIASALQYFLAASPDAALVLTCGSAGGDICYRLANKDAIAARLDGMALLGSFADTGYFQSKAAARKVPIFIAHGSRDTVFGVETLEAFYEKARGAGIPARMVRFESGTHGTPIRMADWREAINWMLAN